MCTFEIFAAEPLHRRCRSEGILIRDRAVALGRPGGLVPVDPDLVLVLLLVEFDDACACAAGIIAVAASVAALRNAAAEIDACT